MKTENVAGGEMQATLHLCSVLGYETRANRKAWASTEEARVTRDASGSFR